MKRRYSKEQIIKIFCARQGMILGNAPPFDEILHAIGELEARLNALGKTPQTKPYE